MFDLKGLPPYTLDEHDDLPEGDRPTFWRSLPTAEDISQSMIAAAAAAKATNPDAKPSDLDSFELMVQLVASTLYRVDNIADGNVPRVYPEARAERVQFVRRLPIRWIQAMGQDVQSDADVDAEEESDSSEAGGSDDAQAGGLRLQDVSGERAA